MQTRGFSNAMQRRVHTMPAALAFVSENSLVDPVEQLLYVVARGSRPGVYPASQQADKQTSGFTDSLQHRFYSLEDTLAYIEENRDLDQVDHPLYVLDQEGETFDEEDMSN